MPTHLDHMRRYLIQGNLLSENNIAVDRSAVLSRLVHNALMTCELGACASLCCKGCVVNYTSVLYKCNAVHMSCMVWNSNCT